MPGPPVDGQDLQLRLSANRHPQQYLAAVRVLDKVRRKLGGNEPGTIGIGFAKTELRREGARREAHGRRLALFDDLDRSVRRYFHLVITTRVPQPRLDLMSNSLVSRLAPDRPRPRPPPVV